MLTKEKTYTVATTWDEFTQTVADLHKYLDTCKEKQQKERLAFDTETYVWYKTRERLDKEYAWSLLKAKEKKAVEAGEMDLPNVRGDYPVPDVHKNKYGEREGRVRLLQFGLNPDNANVQYIVDLDKLCESVKGFLPDVTEDQLVIAFYHEVGKLLQPLFDRAWIIGQNLKYEYKFMWKFFGCKIHFMRDCYLMNQVRYMGDKISHKLSSLYEYHIPEDKFIALAGMSHAQYHIFKKEEQKSRWFEYNLKDSQLKYASEDVYLIWYVFEALLKELTYWSNKHDTGKPGTGVLEIVQLECELIKAIAKAEVIGFKLDKDYYFNEVKPLCLRKIEEAQAKAKDLGFMKTIVKDKKIRTGKGKDLVIQMVQEITEEEYNLNSPAQVASILGPELCQMLPKTPKGGVSTKSDELVFLRDKHPIIPLVSQIKKALKIMSFFESTDKGYFAFCDSDDIINHTIHQIGTSENAIDTGRMAGSDPNLMNVPAQGTLFGEIKAKKLVKRAFVALPGYKLIILDYSQIEPRITAELSKDSFLIGCFRDGRDMHAETARSVFLLDFLPIKGHTEEHWRDKGKIMRLARTYLMGLTKAVRKVYVDTDGSLDFALRGEEGVREFQEILERLDATTPEVSEMRKEIEREVGELAKLKGSLASFRNGAPFYVGKSIMGRTRSCCLSPEERARAVDYPEEFHSKYEVLYERTGKISSWANKFNSKLRDASRELFNNRIQSSAADIFKLAIVEINAALESLVRQGLIDEYSEGMINYVHDEIIIQAKEEHVEILKKLAQTCMKAAGERFIKLIPVEIEVGVGSNWFESK